MKIDESTESERLVPSKGYRSEVVEDSSLTSCDWGIVVGELKMINKQTRIRSTSFVSLVLPTFYNRCSSDTIDMDCIPPVYLAPKVELF